MYQKQCLYYHRIGCRGKFIILDFQVLSLAEHSVQNLEVLDHVEEKNHMFHGWIRWSPIWRIHARQGLASSWAVLKWIQSQREAKMHFFSKYPPPQLVWTDLRTSYNWWTSTSSNKLHIYSNFVLKMLCRAEFKVLLLCQVVNVQIHSDLTKSSWNTLLTKKNAFLFWMQVA